jgi:hypothetical protein
LAVVARKAWMPAFAGMTWMNGGLLVAGPVVWIG